MTLEIVSWNVWGIKHLKHKSKILYHARRHADVARREGMTQVSAASLSD